MNTRTRLLLLTMATAVLLAGCSDDQPVRDQVPRSVKIETIGAAEQAQMRFVASVRQEQRAELSFENGGRVASIDVDVGDRVQQGQALARLDEQPIRLRLQQAEANVRSAVAQLDERRTQLRQQQAMFADGAVSKATLTSAQVALEAAQAQLQVAESDRALAQRALRQSVLRAPFDGSVVARLSQPAADVGTGQTVLQLEGQGRMQAIANLPPDVVQAFAPGQEVKTAEAGTDTAQAVALRVRSISTRRDNGGGVQVIFDVVRATSTLHSGDSLVLALTRPALPISVPLTAVLPHVAGDRGEVYVYDERAGVVRRRTVTLGSVEGERVHLSSGVTRGDRIVVTGTAFLTDGQKAQPFRSPSHLVTGGES